MCVCVRVWLVFLVLVKHPVLPPSVVDGCFRTPHYYYYYYVVFNGSIIRPIRSLEYACICVLKFSARASHYSEAQLEQVEAKWQSGKLHWFSSNVGIETVRASWLEWGSFPVSCDVNVLFGLLYTWLSLNDSNIWFWTFAGKIAHS